jgi:hypothetical protein
MREADACFLQLLLDDRGVRGDVGGMRLNPSMWPTIISITAVATGVNMKTIFEELQSGGFSVVQRLVVDQQEEGVSLDFKQKADDGLDAGQAASP